LRRRGGAVDGDAASGSSRPKRAAAMASSYGERRVSSSDSGNEEWVSGESDGDGEEDADGRRSDMDGSDLGEDNVGEEGDKECLDEDDAHDEVRDGASASSTGRVGSHLASNKDEKSLAGPDEQDHSPRKRRKIVDDEEEDESYGTEGAHEGSAIGVDDESGALDRIEAHEKGLRVRNSSDAGAIAALVKGRERASWVGKSVRKHFRQHGCYMRTRETERACCSERRCRCCRAACQPADLLTCRTRAVKQVLSPDALLCCRYN